jgi:cobalt-zinc-cadmium efflux system membrane fusion protein
VTNRTRAAVLAACLLAAALGAAAPAAAADEGAADEGAATTKESASEKAPEVKLTPEALKRYGITTAKAQRVRLRPTVAAPARFALNTEAMAQIGSAVTGRVVELKARQGDTVKAGDPLLVIESPELGEAQSDYLQKRTAVGTAAPAVELAKSAYDRAKALYDQSQGITLSDVQKREGEWRAAEGALQSAKAALTAANNKLQLLGMNDAAVETLEKTGKITPRYTVNASIGGEVLARNVTLGELVNPEKASLLIIADLRTLWVLADVAEGRAGDIAVGSAARVEVTGGRGGEFTGKVTYISPLVDEQTRTVQVRLEVARGEAALKPGQFARVRIETAAAASEAEKPALVVPDAAVQTVEGQPAVFVPVPGEAGTFAKRPVKVGPAVGGMVPVLSGIKEGDPVVVSGSFVLKAELGKGAGDED